ncbi:MAG: hypothetical protein RLZZ405_802 [Verrucomicrobiota bacterium]|jgi:hypothetical protein
MDATPQIHVARKTVQLGVFTPEEVVAGLASGRFLSTDLAWTNGLAAWKPLGAWPEFAAASNPPPSPLGAESATVVGEPLTWEKSKGLRSAWISFTEVLVRPSPTLTVSRLELGSVLSLAWILAALAAVFLIVGGSLHAEANAAYQRAQAAQMTESISAAKGSMDWLAPWAEYLLKAEPASVTSLVVQGILMVLFGPLLNLLLGIWVWLGLRSLGLLGVASLRRTDFGRTVAASALALTAVGLLSAPVNLLPASAGALLGLPLLIVLLVVACRALAAALRVDGWAVFGALLAFNFLACCLLGCCLGGLVALFVA